MASQVVVMFPIPGIPTPKECYDIPALIAVKDQDRDIFIVEDPNSFPLKKIALGTGKITELESGRLTIMLSITHDKYLDKLSASYFKAVPQLIEKDGQINLCSFNIVELPLPDIQV